MLSDEDRLLICCADMRGKEDVSLHAQEILSRDLNWAFLTQKAIRHGIAPLLYANLLKLNDKDKIPDEIIKRLSTIYHTNALRNIKLEDELITILKCFNHKHIECMILKGLFLLKSIYKNMAMRPIMDIDFLVHFEDLSQIDAALRQLGYSFQSDNMPAKFYHRVHFHVLYLDDRRRFIGLVEVHWNIQDQFNLLKIEIDQIWERAFPWEIGDTKASAMCPEDLLAYLCYHADKHGCYSKYIKNYSLLGPEMVLRNGSPVRLLWYAEILKLTQLQESKLNWSLLIENCQNWGIEGEVHATLTLINKTFDASIAVEALSELNPPQVRRLHATLYPQLLPGAKAKTSHPHSLTGKLKTKFLSAYSTLQFRPARLLDLSTYVFPDMKSVSRYYSTSPPFLYFYYIAHVIKASFRSMGYFILLTYYTLRRYCLLRVKRLRKSQ